MPVFSVAPSPGSGTSVTVLHMYCHPHPPPQSITASPYSHPRSTGSAVNLPFTRALLRQTPSEGVQVIMSRTMSVKSLNSGMLLRAYGSAGYAKEGLVGAKQDGGWGAPGAPSASGLREHNPLPCPWMARHRPLWQSEQARPCCSAQKEGGGGGYSEGPQGKPGHSPSTTTSREEKS